MLKDILLQSYGELFIIHSSPFTFIKKYSVFLYLLDKNAPTRAPYKEKRIKYRYNIDTTFARDGDFSVTLHAKRATWVKVR